MSRKTCSPRVITPNLFLAFPTKALLALAAACCFATTASAADASAPRDVFVPAPPVATEASRWAGIYAGVGVSAVLRTTQIDRGVGSAAFSEGIATVTPSIYAGFNFDGPGNFLWGFEGDAVFTGKGTNFTDPSLGTFERGGRFLSTARVRAGVEVGSGLLYATGGLALTNYEVRPSSVAGSDVNWRAGVAIGAGVEYALNDKWSLRGEGIYTHFGNKDDIVFAGTARRVKDRFGQIRVGLTRSF